MAFPLKGEKGGAVFYGTGFIKGRFGGIAPWNVISNVRDRDLVHWLKGVGRLKVCVEADGVARKANFPDVGVTLKRGFVAYRKVKRDASFLTRHICRVTPAFPFAFSEFR